MFPDALFLFSFIVADASVETLRRKLIDALESHSDMWSSSRPKLKPAKYFGLGQAWCCIGLGSHAWRKCWEPWGRGPTLILPVPFTYMVDTPMCRTYILESSWY